MTLSVAQRLTDRDLQFSDWGTTITFREVVQTYNEQTQQVSESTTDTEVRAILGDSPSEPTPTTAGQHLGTELSVLIKIEEFPLSAPNNTSRIQHDGREYHVVSYRLSPDELVYALVCQQI